MGRRTAQGRLSEVFGEATLPIDRLMRRFDIYRLAQESVAAQDPYALAALEAYAAGVNARLEEINRDALGRGAPAQAFAKGNARAQRQQLVGEPALCDKMEGIGLFLDKKDAPLRQQGKPTHRQHDVETFEQDRIERGAVGYSPQQRIERTLVLQCIRQVFRRVGTRKLMLQMRTLNIVVFAHAQNLR